MLIVPMHHFAKFSKSWDEARVQTMPPLLAVPTGEVRALPEDRHQGLLVMLCIPTQHWGSWETLHTYHCREDRKVGREVGRETYRLNLGTVLRNLRKQSSEEGTNCWWVTLVSVALPKRLTIPSR